MTMSDSTAIDMIVMDEENDKLILIMTEHRSWDNHLAQMHQEFVAKANNYVRYVLSDDFASKYPNLTPKDVVIKLDCAHTPGETTVAYFEQVQQELKKHRIGFEYEVFQHASGEKVEGERVEYQEAYENLKSRALDFHFVLRDNGVYHKPISDEEFLERIEPDIRNTADNLAKGRGDPWATVLGFPVGLLSSVDDCLCRSSFDGMGGPKAFYEALQTILAQAGFQLSWHFAQDAEKLQFKVASVMWDVECKSLKWIDDPISHSRIEPNLTDFLEHAGLYLYPITTGDSFLEYLLIPLETKSALKKYLIAAHGDSHPEHDARDEWLYNGVPEDKRPPSIWDL